MLKYFQTWKLKVSITKAVSAAVHLNKGEAKRELKVNFNDETLPICSEPKYLGVALDGTHTYVSSSRVTSQKADITRRTLEAACWLGLWCWGNNVANSHLSSGPFNPRVLRPCRCRGAHTRLIDPVIKDALQTVSGCLRPTPTNNLPILVGIQSAELRGKGATLSLACRAIAPGHLLHTALTCPPSANARLLKSKHCLYPPQSNSSVHLTTKQKCGALGGSPMECGVDGEHHETPYCHLPTSGTILLWWPYQEQRIGPA